MPCLVITFISLYMLYFYNDDISDSGWSIIKNIANNKVMLLIYYILIFLGYYVWMFLFLIACFSPFENNKKIGITYFLLNNKY